MVPAIGNYGEDLLRFENCPFYLFPGLRKGDAIARILGKPFAMHSPL
jgi:hypothetical protein